MAARPGSLVPKTTGTSSRVAPVTSTTVVRTRGPRAGVEARRHVAERDSLDRRQRDRDRDLDPRAEVPARARVRGIGRHQGDDRELAGPMGLDLPALRDADAASRPREERHRRLVDDAAAGVADGRGQRGLLAHRQRHGVRLHGDGPARFVLLQPRPCGPRRRRRVTRDERRQRGATESLHVALPLIVSGARQRGRGSAGRRRSGAAPAISVTSSGTRPATRPGDAVGPRDRRSGRVRIARRGAAGPQCDICAASGSRSARDSLPGARGGESPCPGKTFAVIHIGISGMDAFAFL